MVNDKFDGPLKNRECRDVLFLVLFLAFIGGMVSIHTYTPQCIYSSSCFLRLCFLLFLLLRAIKEECIIFKKDNNAYFKSDTHTHNSVCNNI